MLSIAYKFIIYVINVGIELSERSLFKNCHNFFGFDFNEFCVNIYNILFSLVFRPPTLNKTVIRPTYYTAATYYISC